MEEIIVDINEPDDVIEIVVTEGNDTPVTVHDSGEDHQIAPGGEYSCQYGPPPEPESVMVHDSGEDHQIAPGGEYSCQYGPPDPNVIYLHFAFPVDHELHTTITIPEGMATITDAESTNVASYTLEYPSGNPVTLPLSVTAGETLKCTVVKTNAAIAAELIIHD